MASTRIQPEVVFLTDKGLILLIRLLRYVSLLNRK